MLKAEGIMKMTPKRYQEIVAIDLEGVLDKKGGSRFSGGKNDDLCIVCMNINEQFGKVLNPTRYGVYQKDSFFKFDSGKTVLNISTDTYPCTTGNLPNCFIHVFSLDDAKFAELLKKYPSGIPVREYTLVGMRNPGYACNEEKNPEAVHAYLLKILENGLVEKTIMGKALKALSDLAEENAKMAINLLTLNETIRKMIGGAGEQ